MTVGAPTRHGVCCAEKYQHRISVAGGVALPAKCPVAFCQAEIVWTAARGTK